LQFLAPTGTFFLGVSFYHEPFARDHLIIFALIWIALAIFTGEALMQWRRRSVPAMAMPITQ
jgi:chloramphenicol-sensitive protein RarD